jgi:magnesium chelatase family protein
MVGPPGAGKSMLAARLPSILPPLAPAELLEVSMVASVAGAIKGGALTNRRPFRAPHHSASMPALVAAAFMRVRAKSRSPIMGFCFLTNCRNFSRKHWIRCVNR